MANGAGVLTRRALIGWAAAAAIAPSTRARAAEIEPRRDAASLRFLALGDWGKPNSDGQRLVARAMVGAARAAPPDFIVSAGDNFYPAGVSSVFDRKWQTVFRSVYADPALMCPWYAVLGNHDHRGSVDAQIDYSWCDPRWRMPGRFYRTSETLPAGGTADFFFLDTSVIADTTYIDTAMARQQLMWLASALAGSTALCKIVVGHHPVFSGGRHGSTDVLVSALKPIFDRYNVAAYISAHNHNLEHILVGDVHYLTSGAGAAAKDWRPTANSIFGAAELGFLSVNISSAGLEFSFVSARGEILHHAEVAAGRAGQRRFPLFGATTRSDPEVPFRNRSFRR